MNWLPRCIDRKSCRVSLARWRDPSPHLFSAIPRCLDRKACRDRCEALGDDWPVMDPHEPSVLPEVVA